MAKVAVLVPNQEMSTIAKSLTGEFPSISMMAIESIQTDQAVRRAGELEQQGCDLIVARGVQARAIKRSVKLPLVEISVSQQELASVVLELKEELGLPCPPHRADRAFQYVQRHFPVRPAVRHRSGPVYGGAER